MVQWVTIATKLAFLCSCDPTSYSAQKEPQIVEGTAKPTPALPPCPHTPRGCGDPLHTQGRFRPRRARLRQGKLSYHVKVAEVSGEVQGQ